MRRVFAIVSLTLLAALAAGILAAWYLLHDEAFLKARLSGFMLEFSGRELRIEGPLRLQPGRLTTLEAEDIHLANADWAAEPEMARVGRLSVTIDIPSLFGDLPVLPDLRVADCRVRLEQNQRGENNWSALAGPPGGQPPAGAPGEGAPVLLLDNRVQNCSIVFDSPERPQPLRIAVDDLDLRLVDRVRWQARAAGRVGDEALDLSGWMEPQGAALRGDPSEHELDLQLGDIHLSSAGRFENSKTGAGADLELRFAGPDFAAVLAHLGLPLFSDGAFDFQLSLDTQDSMVELKMDGALGRLSARAEGTLDRLARPTRGSVSAAVSGPRLDLLGRALGLDGLASTAYDFEANVRFEPGRVLLDSSKLDAGGDSLGVAGSLGTGSGLANSDLEVSLESTEFGAWAGLWGEEPRTLGTLSLNGRLRSDAEGLFAYGGDIRLDDHRLTLDGPLGKVSGELRTEVAFDLQSGHPASLAALAGITDFPDEALTAGGRLGADAQQLRLDDVHLALGRHRAQAHGVVTLKAPHTGTQLQLQIDSPDAAEVGGFLGREGLPATAWKSSMLISRPDEGLRVQDLVLDLGPNRLEADVRLIQRQSHWVPDALTSRLRSPDLSQLASMFGVADLPPEPVDLRLSLQREVQGFRFEARQTATDSLRLDATGTIPDLERPLTMNAEIDARLPSLALLSYFKPDFPWPELPFTVQGTLRTREQGLALAGLSAALGDSRMEGELEVILGEVNTLSGSLQSPFLDLTPWLQKAREADTADRPEARAPAFVFDDTPIKRLVPIGWVLDLQARIARAAVAAGEVENVEFGIRLADQRLEVSPFSLVGKDGGKARGGFVLDSSKDESEFELELRGDSVRSGLLSPRGIPRERIPTVDLDLSLAARGQTRREMASGLDGRIRLYLGPGQVAYTGVEFLFTDFLTELFRLLNPFAEKSQATNLDCAVAAADIQAGRMRVYPVVFHTDKLTIFSKGSIDLGSERIDLSFNTKPRKGLGITTGVLINPLIKVGGTLARPAVEFDPAHAIVSGGAAVATAGITLLAKGFADRFLSSKDPCGDARKEIAGREAG